MARSAQREPRSLFVERDVESLSIVCSTLLARCSFAGLKNMSKAEDFETGRKRSRDPNLSSGCKESRGSKVPRLQYLFARREAATIAGATSQPTPVTVDTTSFLNEQGSTASVDTLDQARCMNVVARHAAANKVPSTETTSKLAYRLAQHEAATHSLLLSSLHGRCCPCM